MRMSVLSKRNISFKVVLYYLLGFSIVGLVFFLPITYLLHYTQDDSFFYLKIAQNIVCGYGSTFDTINRTNGYHPLWLLVLVFVYYPLSVINSITPEILLRVTFLITIILNLLTLKILRKLLNHLFTGLDAMIIYSAQVLLSVTVLFNTIGLEIQLVLLFLSSYLFLLFKKQYPRLRLFITGLLCIARIDLLFFIMPIVLFLEYEESFKGLSLKEVIKYLMAPSILIVTYYLFNYLYFGSFISTSAKVEFRPDLLLFSSNFPLPHSQPIRFMLFCYSLSGGVLFLFANGLKKHHLRNGMFMLWVSSVIYLFVHFLFNLNGARDWYYGVPAFFSTILLVQRINEHRNLRNLVFYVSLSILLLYITIFRINYLKYDDAYFFALSVKKHTNANDRIFMIDMSGFLGFFSERIVVNGDGLVNSHQYLQLLREKNLQNYFLTLGITHYATYTYTQPFIQYVFEESNYSWFPYKFVFPKENLVVSSQKVHGGLFRKKFGQFLLFRLNRNL